MNPVLFPFKVNILEDPVPSFVMVPPPVNKPVTVTAPSPPIDNALVAPVAIAPVALLNVKVFASEFNLEPDVFTVIDPDKVLLPLVLGIHITPLPTPVPLIVMYSGIEKLVPTIFKAAPSETTVL